MVGIIGGMSWESTASYYSQINREYNRRMGGHHSAPVLIHSVDFAPIEEMQREDDWDGAAQVLISAGQGLRRAGAELILLATNTMHIVFDQLATAVPGMLHIADPAGAALQAAGHQRVGLLGTRFTMERDFYRQHLEKHYSLDVIVPPEKQRREIDRVIFQELVRGTINDASRRYYQLCIADLAASGATAVILGCTEIGLLISPEDVAIPVIDTTTMHTFAAVEWIIGQ